MYTLKHLITEPTSVIDIILTNRKRSFCDSQTIETGLSDHHKMIITVVKPEFKKKEHTQVNYRSYKNVNEYLFRHDLSSALSNLLNEDTNYEILRKCTLIF